MLRIGSIVIRVRDLERQLAFWTAALDYVPRDPPSSDWAVLRPRNGVGPNVSLDLKRSEYGLPPRLHLDLYADDREAEVQRLVSLGATPVPPPGPVGDTDWTLMEDPEGNRFDVVDAPRSTG